MNAIDSFAAEAKRFEEWACRPDPPGAAAIRLALTRITSLYLAALELPDVESELTSNETDQFQVTAEEGRSVCANRSLPIDAYGLAYEPLIIPPEEAMIGSLSDDIIDIYADVVSGLRAYQAGHCNDAAWEWKFSFRTHWGRHATGAIGALHACLEESY